MLYAVIYYFSVKYLLPLLLPFIVGLAIAAAVQKPAELLSSRIPRLNKKLCCILLTIFAMLTAAILLVGIITSICGCAAKICPCIPQYFSDAVAFIHNHSNHFHQNSFLNLFWTAAEWLRSFISENYTKYLPDVLSRSTSMLSGIPSFFTRLFFAVLSAVFACTDYPRLTRYLKKAIPPRYESTASSVIHSAVFTLTSLLKTYGLLMLITFCELAALLTVLNLLGFGVGNIISTALIISIVDILPVLGTGTVLIPWGLFELVTGRTLFGVLLIVMCVIIGLVRNMLEPKLIGKRLDLPPFVTLACVYIGAVVFGWVGIIVLPLTVIIIRDNASA